MSKLSKKSIENRVATVTNTHQSSLKRYFRAVVISVRFRPNAGGSSSLPSWTSTIQTAGHTYMDNEWEFFLIQTPPLTLGLLFMLNSFVPQSPSPPGNQSEGVILSHPSDRWGSLCGSEQDESTSEHHLSVRCLTHGNKPAAFSALCRGRAPVFKDAEPLI